MSGEWVDHGPILIRESRGETEMKVKLPVNRGAMSEATTVVQAKTYDEALPKAMEQFRSFFGVRDFSISRSHADAIGTVAGTIIAWDCTFWAEAKT